MIRDEELNRAIAEAHSHAREAAAEVVEACCRAGHPEFAAAAIRSNRTPAEVRAMLTERPHAAAASQARLDMHAIEQAVEQRFRAHGGTQG